MKKDCIDDFIDSWSRWDGVNKQDDFTWNYRLRNAGYYGIKLNDIKEWNEVLVWCNENIGRAHYGWSGTTFWFKTEKDAALFALKWS